jgi:hypothetical protein
MSTPPVEITGVRTSPKGEVVLVELEATRGGTRIALGQNDPASSLPPLRGLLVDGRPAALFVGTDGSDALVLLDDDVTPLAAVELTDPLTEANVHRALADERGRRVGAGHALPRAVGRRVRGAAKRRVPVPRSGAQ